MVRYSMGWEGRREKTSPLQDLAQPGLTSLMTPSPKEMKGPEPLFLHSPPNVSPTYFISLLSRLKEDFLGVWVKSASLYHEHREMLGKLQFSHLKDAFVKHNTTVKYATVPLLLLSLPLLP